MRMRKFFEDALYLFYPFVVVYLIAIFATGKFDIREWTEGVRETAASVLILIYIFR